MKYYLLSTNENKNVNAKVNARVKTNRTNEANKTDGINNINYKVSIIKYQYVKYLDDFGETIRISDNIHSEWLFWIISMMRYL